MDRHDNFSTEGCFLTLEKDGGAQSIDMQTICEIGWKEHTTTLRTDAGTKHQFRQTRSGHNGLLRLVSSFRFKTDVQDRFYKVMIELGRQGFRIIRRPGGRRPTVVFGAGLQRLTYHDSNDSVGGPSCQALPLPTQAEVDSRTQGYHPWRVENEEELQVALSTFLRVVGKDPADFATQVFNQIFGDDFVLLVRGRGFMSSLNREELEGFVEREIARGPIATRSSNP